MMEQRSILGTPVHVTTYHDAAEVVLGWATRGERRSVCAANVHLVMEAYDSPDFRRAVRNADLITSDGMPLVWCLRLLGSKAATRVYGPDLMLWVLAAAERECVPVGLYGGSLDTLELLASTIARRFPSLPVVFRESPPFRALSDEEETAALRRINASGARLVFVGLGCPKQEYWMSAHKHRLHAVLLGVGAAFDFIAGTKSQAPPLMRAAGFEWLFRLATEPRRLWRRYTRHNPRFVARFLSQLMRPKKWSAQLDGPTGAE